jgi:two-component system, NarL family, invasion response regulator UvrY
MPNNSSVRILVAEDHQITLTGIITMLKCNGNLIVAATAKTGDELIKNYFEFLPDLVITDISMPGLSGIAAIRKIKEKDKKLKALFLSMYYSETMFRICIDAGGQGLINKDAGDGELIEAAEAVYKGNFYFKKNLDNKELTEILNKNIIEYQSIGNEFYPIHLLTKRELEVFKLIGQGLGTEEICHKLVFEERTFRFHQNNLMLKLDINSSKKLIAVASRYLIEEILGNDHID